MTIDNLMTIDYLKGTEKQQTPLLLVLEDVSVGIRSVLTLL